MPCCREWVILLIQSVFCLLIVQQIVKVSQIDVAQPVVRTGSYNITLPFVCPVVRRPSAALSTARLRTGCRQWPLGPVQPATAEPSQAKRADAGRSCGGPLELSLLIRERARETVGPGRQQQQQPRRNSNSSTAVVAVISGVGNRLDIVYCGYAARHMLTDGMCLDIISYLNCQ